MFRSSDFWHGTVYEVPMHEITRNKLRAADAWMDSYARLVHRHSPALPDDNPVGDISQLQDIRERLQCKSFQWSVRLSVVVRPSVR